MDESAIDVTELAAWLKVSRDTAYGLARDPLFPSFRVGNRHRFWPSEVKAYLATPFDLWAKPSRRKVDRNRRYGR